MDADAVVRWAEDWNDALNLLLGPMAVMQLEEVVDIPVAMEGLGRHLVQLAEFIEDIVESPSDPSQQRHWEALTSLVGQIGAATIRAVEETGDLTPVGQLASRVTRELEGMTALVSEGYSVVRGRSETI